MHDSSTNPILGELVTIFIVLKMLSPSKLSGLFEWIFLRYWDKTASSPTWCTAS